MVHVRAEFGPSARVIRAERIRTGGIAGFFARERYELTVDVQEPAPAPVVLPRARRLPTEGPGPAGIDALLAAADAADGAGAGTGTTTTGTTAATAGLPGTDVAVPAGADVAARGAVAAAPRVSTGEQMFASVLEQVRAMAGDQPVPVASESVPAARTFEPMTAVTVLESSTGPAGPARPAAPVSGQSLAAPAPPAPGGQPTDRDALLDLGVPERLLPAVAGTEAVALSAVMAGVPHPPPVLRRAGSVLVVVGPAAEAVTVAGQLSDRLRQPVAGVVHAGMIEPVAGHGRRLATPAAAERWRARTGESEQVAIVALGTGPDQSDLAAAAELVAALAPDQLWAVVDARAKRRDCLRWLAAVGARRPVDALAVRGLFETSEPGTVLDLGVPVAWMDGVPATRVAWAAALSQHLDPDASWD
ncbi:hypothetical protein [Cellulomonas hominis]